MLVNNLNHILLDTQRITCFHKRLKHHLMGSFHFEGLAFKLGLLVGLPSILRWIKVKGWNVY